MLLAIDALAQFGDLLVFAVQADFLSYGLAQILFDGLQAGGDRGGDLFVDDSGERLGELLVHGRHLLAQAAHFRVHHLPLGGDGVRDFTAHAVHAGLDAFGELMVLCVEKVEVSLDLGAEFSEAPIDAAAEFGEASVEGRLRGDSRTGDERRGVGGRRYGAGTASAFLHFRDALVERAMFGGRGADGGKARRVAREGDAHAERQAVPKGNGQGSPNGRIAATLHIT